MIRRTLYALVVPVALQILGILLYQRFSLNLLQTARNLTSALILFSLFWGLLFLVPMGIAQILSVVALVRSKCSNRELFIAGALNPALALVAILAVGWPGAVLDTEESATDTKNHAEQDGAQESPTALRVL